MVDVTNVIALPVLTNLDIPVTRVLDAAKDAKLKHVIVIGATEDGYLYFASSISDAAQINWDMEQAKSVLLRESD